MTFIVKEPFRKVLIYGFSYPIPRIHVHATMYETGAVVHAPKVSQKFLFFGFMKVHFVSYVHATVEDPKFCYICSAFLHKQQRKNRIKRSEFVIKLHYLGFWCIQKCSSVISMTKSHFFLRVYTDESFTMFQLVMHALVPG